MLQVTVSACLININIYVMSKKSLNSATASVMTYTVSAGALNSTHLLLLNSYISRVFDCVTISVISNT